VRAPPTTTRPSRRGSRRGDFLQVAAELFAERGYAGTSVDDVGAALGVSGPAVYWHFDSKDALLTQMLADISDRLLAGGTRCVERAGDHEEALRSLVRFQVRFALDHPELITVHARDLAHVPEPSRRRIRRTQRLYVEQWVGALGGIAPAVHEDVRRAATHAALGLINSTPHLGGSLGTARSARLLETMAMAALDAAVRRPGRAGRSPRERWAGG
jgi:AcrR family transcriptional regulator